VLEVDGRDNKAMLEVEAKDEAMLEVEAKDEAMLEVEARDKDVCGTTEGCGNLCAFILLTAPPLLSLFLLSLFLLSSLLLLSMLTTFCSAVISTLSEGDESTGFSSLPS